MKVLFYRENFIRNPFGNVIDKLFAKTRNMKLKIKT